MKNQKEIVEILNRITGKNVDINSKIKLSSAQQYAFITLCKKSGKIINKNLINNAFTINEILNAKKYTDKKDNQNVSKKLNITQKVRSKNNFAIGIDIQNIAEFSKLIDANDLKKSSFIKDYFTDKEISYSESRPNSIETICGIFSAKESIRKTGNKDNFKNIEITHVEGRPVCGNYYISISHSAEVCVAVCIQT